MIAFLSPLAVLITLLAIATLPSAVATFSDDKGALLANLHDRTYHNENRSDDTFRSVANTCTSCSGCASGADGCKVNTPKGCYC